MDFSCCATAGLRADEPAAKISYDEHVRPILREHCATCHNQDTKKSDLAIDSYAAIMHGGASGEVVAPGDLDGSRLWGLVNHTEEPKMPPNQDKLADAKLQIIKAWILGGALENAGSTAKTKKPTMNLSLSGGSAKPDGPAIMPEGLWRQPIVTHRARRSRHGSGLQPLGAARGRGRSKANSALPFRFGRFARRAAVSRRFALCA